MRFSGRWAENGATICFEEFRRQAKPVVVARFADWERERQRLLEALKQKDGMVAMLSSAFQGSLKK